jgi:hypothetical protein
MSGVFCKKYGDRIAIALEPRSCLCCDECCIDQDREIDRKAKGKFETSEAVLGSFPTTPGRG